MGFKVGISIGSIVIVFALVALAFHIHKKHTFRKNLKNIGRTAEEAINEDIKIWARHTNNRFIWSHIIKYDEDKYFEIDSVIITDKAVIVVEIKSIKGKVTGGASHPYWVKEVADKQFHITNPIMQNDKHIKHIINMLQTKVPIISLIIYSNRTTSIELDEVPDHVAVIRHPELYETLDGIDRALPPKLSIDEMKSIEQSFKNHMVTSTKDRLNFKKIIRGGKIWK